MNRNKKVIFKGAGTALVTPFKDGKIDYASLGALIEYQIQSGIDALIIGGTTGEAATLSDGERYELYGFAKEKTAGRTKLIFGTGTNDTRVALAHTKFAEEIGGDGALLVTPYYNKGTEEGIFRHYSTIADACGIPLILYNVPGRTGVNMGLNLLRRLSEHPNIVGLKEAGDSVDRLVALASIGDTLPLYSGNDSQIYPALALGGLGVISVASNMYPKTVSKICSAYFDGDATVSRRLQFAILPFVKAIFAETNPAPIKYAMAARDIISSEVRLPLSVPREDTKLMLEGEIPAMELIENGI